MAMRSSRFALPGPNAPSPLAITRAVILMDAMFSSTGQAVVHRSFAVQALQDCANDLRVFNSFQGGCGHAAWKLGAGRSLAGAAWVGERANDHARGDSSVS